MYNIRSLVFLTCLGVAICLNCQNLSGTWRNQLGSNMTLIHQTDTRLTGEYSTAVESRLNAAVVSSNITGMFIPLDNGSLLSFTVLFNRGKSLTTWIGQCLVCDGKEILFTSWALKSYIRKQSERWMSTKINQDTFWRIPGNENVPYHLRRMGPWPKDERSQTCEKNIKAAEGGKWVAENSDTLDFDECYESGVFSGLNSEKIVAGRSDGGEPFTTLGIVSGYEDTVKGWAGLIYENLDDRKLDTVWLSHSFSNNCRDPRMNVRLGMTNYTFEENYENSSGNSMWSSLWSFFNSDS